MTEEKERHVWEVATTAIYKHIEDIEKRLIMAIDQSSQISSMVTDRQKEALQDAFKGITEKLNAGERRFDYIEKEIKEIGLELCDVKNKNIVKINNSLTNIKTILDEFNTFINECPNHEFKVKDVITKLNNLENAQIDQIKRCDWHKIMTEDYETSWKKLPEIIKLYEKFKTYRIFIIGIGLGVMIMSGIGGTELLKALIETAIKLFI